MHTYHLIKQFILNYKKYLYQHIYINIFLLHVNAEYLRKKDKLYLTKENYLTAILMLSN